MARIHGSRGGVSMDPAGGTTYVAVADLNSWNLSLSKDKVDVTAFLDTNKQKVLGLPDFSGTLGGFWNSATTPALFDAVLGNAAVGIKLIQDTADATHFFSGLGYLDGSVSVDSNGAVTIGSSFEAAGNWALAP